MRDARAKAEDFLTEIVAERTAKDAAFPALVSEAETRRKRKPTNPSLA